MAPHIPIQQHAENENNAVSEITDKMYRLFGVRWILSLPPVAPPDGQTAFVEKTIPSVENIQNSTKIFDRAIARELNGITQTQRVALLHEMHGVQSRSSPETEASVSMALEQMQTEISTVVNRCDTSKIHKQQNFFESELIHGHMVAVQKLKSTYVQTPDFRLRFLRTEFFDIPKAAKRYFHCLNHLLHVFGESALMRPLRIDDLDVSEKSLLESGRVQCFRSRDRMGRRVMLWFCRTMSAYPMWVRQRVETFLIFGILGEDKETQLHGAVGIMFMYDLKEGKNKTEIKIDANNHHDTNWTKEEYKIWDQFLGKNLQHRMQYHKRYEATPIRWSAFHFCMPKGRIYQVIRAMVMAIMPSVVRNVTRTHTVSYLECLYQLQQFGVPINDIPGPSAKGIICKTKTLARLLKCRASMDTFRSATRSATIDGDTDTTNTDPITVACPGTDCPDSNCVVFGDRMTYDYPANVAFRDYLRSKEQNRERCDQQLQVRLDTPFLDEIIDEFCGLSIDTSIHTSIDNETKSQERGFRFSTYDRQEGWFRYIDPSRNEDDRIELRKRISQTMRDDRKRTLKINHQQSQQRQQSLQSLQLQSPPAAVGFFGIDACMNWRSNENKSDAKRFKSEHFWRNYD